MLHVPSNCTGCHACASICPHKCIVMKENSAGFLFPEINSIECVQCDLCEKVCPVIHEQQRSLQTLAYAVQNRNETIRDASTSGGIFSLLAENIIDQGGLVFGAAYDDNFTVRHIAIADRQELSHLRGAKYTQSVVGNSFQKVKTILNSGRKVLFSGTPCQCSGLKAFLGRDYDNLLLVDLICHGVPSPKVWQAYIDYRSSKENEGIRPVQINMRSKVSGWSRYRYSTEFDYGDGHITRIHNNRDLFMRAFIGNICLCDSCSDCVAKGEERCTDFTLGDYWGIWDQHPNFDDDKGTSIVFVHSEKGKRFLKQISEQIECLSVETEEACKENESLIKSSMPHKKRGEFLASVDASTFEDLVLEYFPLQDARKTGFFQRIKERVRSTLK